MTLNILRDIWRMNLMVFCIMGLLTILFNIVQVIPLMLSLGFSLSNFAKLIIYNIPQLATIILPLTTAGSALVIYRRMNMEQELTAYTMGGYSPRQIFMPVYATAILLFLIILGLKLFINPVSKLLYAQERQTLQNELVSNLITDGRFYSPRDGITFFIGSKTGINSVAQVFLVDKRQSPEYEQIISAQKGIIIQSGDQISLHLLNGSQHVKEKGNAHLIQFTRYVLDITDMRKSDDRFVKATERNSFDLWDIINNQQSEDLDAKTYQGFIAEFGERFSFPILGVALVLTPCSLLIKPRIFRRKKLAFSSYFAPLYIVLALIIYFIFFGWAKQGFMGIVAMFLLAIMSIILAEATIAMANNRAFFKRLPK